MGEEKKDCKKKKKKGQHGSRGVNARINRAFVEGNKKKICMDGRWIFDFYKKKKSVQEDESESKQVVSNFFSPLSLSLFLRFSIPF